MANKEFCTFVLTTQIHEDAIRFANIIKNTVGGASNCVGLCGNLPFPGLLFNFFTQKSYHK